MIKIQYKRTGDKLFERSFTKKIWIFLWEPGLPCWACKGDKSILTSETKEAMVYSCIKCGYTLKLKAEEWSETIPKRKEGGK